MYKVVKLSYITLDKITYEYHQYVLLKTLANKAFFLRLDLWSIVAAWASRVTQAVTSRATQYTLRSCDSWVTHQERPLENIVGIRLDWGLPRSTTRSRLECADKLVPGFHCLFGINCDREASGYFEQLPCMASHSMYCRWDHCPRKCCLVMKHQPYPQALNRFWVSELKIEGICSYRMYLCVFRILEDWFDISGLV